MPAIFFAIMNLRFAAVFYPFEQFRRRCGINGVLPEMLLFGHISALWQNGKLLIRVKVKIMIKIIIILILTVKYIYSIVFFVHVNVRRDIYPARISGLPNRAVLKKKHIRSGADGCE